MKKLFLTVITLSLVATIFFGCTPDENKDVPVKLKWRFKNGFYGYQAPAVVNGVVYLVDQDGYLKAIDKETCKLIWKFYEYRISIETLLVVDGVVYVEGECSSCHVVAKLYAIDAATGKLKWHFDSGEPSGGFILPVVDDGMVHVGEYKYEPDRSEMFYAIDAENGELKWSYIIENEWMVTRPVVADGVVYVGSIDKYLYAIDADSGELKWKYTTGQYEPGYRVFSNPSVADSVVYEGSWDHYLHAIDADTGELKWRFKAGEAFFSSPTVVDGVVYVGCGDEYLYAINADSGELKWRSKAGIPTFFLSSPTVVDGVVYVGGHDHYVYAIASSNGHQMWKYRAQGPIFSSVVVIDDVIYFGTGPVYFTKLFNKFTRRLHWGPYLYALEIER